MQGHIFACRDNFLHAVTTFCMQGHLFACGNNFLVIGEGKS